MTVRKKECPVQNLEKMEIVHISDELLLWYTHMLGFLRANLIHG